MSGNVDAKLLDVIAKSWTDETFKQKLMADPAGVLASEGIEVPAGATVRVVEQAPNEVFLFLPPRPEGNIEIQNVSSQAAASAKLCQPSVGPSPLPTLTLFCIGQSSSPPPALTHFSIGHSPLPTLTLFCIGQSSSPPPTLTHFCIGPAPTLTFFCLAPISTPLPTLTFFCLAPISTPLPTLTFFCLPPISAPLPTLTWFSLAHTKPAGSGPGEGS